MSPVPKNPVFRRLAIIAGCLALSSAAIWIVANGLGFDTAPDLVVTLCFLSGLLVAFTFIAAGNRSGRRSLTAALCIIGAFAVTLFTWITARSLEMSHGPDDWLYLFVIPGFILSAIAMAVESRANLRAVFTLSFLRVFTGTLIPVCIYWSVIALIGSRIAAWLFDSHVFRRDLWGLRIPENVRDSVSSEVVPFLERFRLQGEEEWFQISLVLVAAFLTFLTWHFRWHRSQDAADIHEPSGDPVLN
jgi:hypothetical protein